MNFKLHFSTLLLISSFSLLEVSSQTNYLTSEESGKELIVAEQGNALLVSNSAYKVIMPEGNSEHHSAKQKNIAGKPVVPELSGVRLKNKIIPLTNPVYQVLDFFEASGKLGFLPQAKPYTKIFIIEILNGLLKSGDLSDKEQKLVEKNLTDLTADTNGLAISRGEFKNNFALAGFSAETSVRTGIGDNGKWGLSLIGEPYLSGDLGEHITFTAAVGLSIEQLRPDMFYQSYTRDGEVNFPYESIGYAYMPYQFNFETMWSHVLAAGTEGEARPVREDLTAGMIYHTELNGSWFDGALQFSINNQRRSWGHDQSNLVLSSSARRFPGFELRIQPARWFRYSFVTGSLFSYSNQRSNYRSEAYDYDLGQVQKNFTAHLFEITPAKWLEISGGGANIWSKRLEIAYMVPFVLPNLTQIDVGDHDNVSLFVDVAGMIPKVGKIWGGAFIDEMNLTKTKDFFKMPRNRFGWQMGWKTNLISGIIPGTTSTLKYTRLTPFVYTHYPDAGFNTFGNRPNDMSYTHDEFNLGFYLPPNSGELNWKLVNIAVPDLVLSLENRLIVHGTNDLASTNVYQIYGDIYRYQMNGPSGDAEYAYPLMDFTKDGIYDWTMMSEFKFDWKIRKSGKLNYYRLVGSLGYSKTWWEANDSQIVAPENKSLMTGSIGIVVEM